MKELYQPACGTTSEFSQSKNCFTWKAWGTTIVIWVTGTDGHIFDESSIFQPIKATLKLSGDI